MSHFEIRYNVTDLISSLSKSLEKVDPSHSNDCDCSCNFWEPENLKRGIFGTHPHQVLALFSRAAFSFPQKRIVINNPKSLLWILTDRLERDKLLSPNDALFIGLYNFLYNEWQEHNLSTKKQFKKLQEILANVTSYPYSSQPCVYGDYLTSDDDTYAYVSFLATINQFHSEIEFRRARLDHADENYECDFRRFPRISRPSIEQRRFGSLPEEKAMLVQIDKYLPIKKLVTANLPMALI